jgi:hypothetical protein
MKSLFTMVGVCMSCILILGAINVSVQAQEPDEIGIYFDPDATEYNKTYAMPYSLVSAYLILHSPSQPSVQGWECRVDVVPTMGSTVTGWYPVGHFGIAPIPPEFQIGLGTALTWAENIVLMRIEVFYFGDQVRFYLSPFMNPTIPGQMAYVDNIVDLEFTVMRPTSGGFDKPVACLGCMDVVENTDLSWGQVRAMYR